MAEYDSELSSLLSGTTLVLIGTVLSASVKLLERVVIGRALSLDAYGEVSIALSVMTLGGTVAAMGLPQGVPRYVSRDEGESEMRGTWATGLTLALLFAAVLTVALLAFTEQIAARLFERQNAASLLRLFVLSIPLTVGMQIGIAGLRGHEHAQYRTYIQDLVFPLSRIGLIAVFLVLGAGVYAVGYAYLIAATLGFVGSHLLLNRLMSLRGSLSTQTTELMRFSAPLVVAAVLSMLLVQTDTLMLGYFRPSSEVALYSAAYPIAYGLILMLTAFGFIYFPMISRLDASGEREQIQDIYQVTVKWILVLTFPVFATFVAFSEDVMTVVFGMRYQEGGIALSILAFGFFVNSAVGRNRQTVSALGDTVILMVTNTIAFGVNVVLNLILIPRYGFVGAAVASACSYATLNLTVSAILYRRFGISPLSSSVKRTMIVLPAVVLVPAYLLSSVVSLNILTLPLFLVGASTVTLVALVVGGGLQSEDQVVIEFLEEKLQIQVPIVRRYLPPQSDEDILSD